LTNQFGGHRAGNKTDGSSEDPDIYSLIDKALNLPLGQSSKQPKSTLLELGADSLGLARIVSSAKRTFGRELDMATMFSFPSVKQVVKMVSEAATLHKSQGIDLPQPAAFSLLQNGDKTLDFLCQQAGVQASDVEDALPLSANQNAYLNVFAGDYRATEIMWQMNTYKVARDTDPKRLANALETLQRHEESLRWVLTEDSKADLMILQLRPGVHSCVETFRCDSVEDASNMLERRLTSCRHQAGKYTAMIFLIGIGQELEMTFIESHLFTEGQGRAQMLEVLNHAYSGQPLEGYASYSSFTERYPVGQVSHMDMEFWRKEATAAKLSEGPDWALKQKIWDNPAEFANDRLDLVSIERSVEAPFKKLTVQMGMTVPLVVEAIYAISLALYFGQQDHVFLRGSVFYDRCVSLRTADPQFSTVRAITGTYHPNFVSLDLARSSLW
jgi:acyl carrier protein